VAAASSVGRVWRVTLTLSRVVGVHAGSRYFAITHQDSDLREALETDGIHVRAGSMPGLAEVAPIAYKDVDRVVEGVHGAGIAKKVARLVQPKVIKLGQN
jgi:RNA-splicing ligase RtcB